MATKKTKTTPKNTSTSDKEPRQVKDAAYKSFSLQKKITQVAALPSAWSIFKRSMAVIKGNYKLFLGIIAWFAVINFVFVQGFYLGGDVAGARDAFDKVFDGGWSQVATGTASFLYLISASGSSSASGSYQFIWLFVVSLALIWTLRQLHNGQKVGVKDGFYKGMYPFVPFFLVLLVIGLQLLPMIAGGFLFTTVMGNGIAVTWAEVAIWAILFFLLVLLSLYLICSSLFALYIVGLPDTTPLVALRSARQLVANRRWSVLRKILFLPFILLVAEGLLMIPLILLVPAAAMWIFFVISAINIAVAHSYYYALYRSLL